MPRGERVGEAYVRIHADGDGMDREIRRMFEDNDGEFDDAGRLGYQHWRKGFEKEATAPKNESALRHSLTKALARSDYLSNDFFKGEAWQGFRNALEERMGDVGAKAADNLEKELRNGMDFSGLRSRLNNMNGVIAKAQKDNYDELLGLFSKYQRDADRLANGLDVGGRSRKDMLADLSKLRGRFHEAGLATDEFELAAREVDRTIGRAHPTLAKFTNRVDALGDGVGRAFGKGSRNNFLNFTGSVVGGMVKLLNIVPNVAKAFFSVGESFRESFNNATNSGASALQATLTTLSSGALLAAGGLLAVVATAGLIGVAVAPAVAGLSLLAGIITALASSIAFGLIGAVGALAGALLPVVGIAGTVAAAFLSLSDAQKAALKVKITPLVNAFKDLGHSAAGTVFQNIGEQAKRLVPIIHSFNPVVKGVGREISNLGDRWLDATKSLGFQTFVAQIGGNMPRLVRKLGIAFGNSLGGIAGIFTGLLPITNRFLTWLDEVTGKFATWANSIHGQTEIKDFFDRAGQSVKDLGHFAKEAFDLVVQLLNAGKGTGDDMFSKMGDAIQRAGDYLEKHPDALGKWFSDAGDAADSIGNLVTALLELGDALDNGGSRGGVIKALDILGAAIHAFAILAGIENTTIGKAVEGIKAAFDLLGKIKIPELKFPTFGGGPSVALMAAPFATLGPKILAAIGNLGGIVGRKFNDIVPFARRVVPIIGAVFSTLAGKIVGFMGGLPGRVGALFNRLPGLARRAATLMPPGFSGVVGRITGLLSGLPGRVGGILNRLPGIARTAANQAGAAFSGVLGRVRGFFNGIPGAVSGILNRLGGIASGAASGAIRAFARVQGGITGHFSGIPGAVGGILGKLAGQAAAAASAVVGKFAGLAGRIIAAVGHITFPKPTIPMPSIPQVHLPTLHWPAVISKVFGHAAGTITTGPEMALIGESGPEAVVPLNRSLSQVDPSVRWLSAIAQGKVLPGSAAPASAPGKQYNIDMTVVTPNSDSRAVASEVIHRLMATGY